jgi:hypothetical protein
LAFLISAAWAANFSASSAESCFCLGGGIYRACEVLDTTGPQAPTTTFSPLASCFSIIASRTFFLFSSFY